jgi:hypothetical protein
VGISLPARFLLVILSVGPEPVLVLLSFEIFMPVIPLLSWVRFRSLGPPLLLVRCPLLDGRVFYRRP